MADANDASEQIKLLTDLGKTDSTLDIFRRQNDLNILAAQAQELQDNQPTQAQLNALSKEAKAQQTAFESGTGLVNQAYEKLGLSEEQGYLSQLSGELSATLAYQLGQQRDRLAARGGNEDRVAAYDSALDQIAGYADSFRAQNGGRDFREILTQEPDRVKDLATEDGFWGLVQKGAATAVAGIPGLGAIAASSFASSEDSLLGRAGQALGGLASDIQSRAPTDIGSSAASQQFQDIQSRAASGEQSTLGAIGESIGLLGDGDFAGDLLANTVGAAAGGGALRAGAGLGARALGASTARQAGTGALNQARQAAPAIGVGLGAGVDENITPGQARLLLGTGVASAGLAGAAGLVGAQVAESAIGNTARNVASRFTGAGAQATDDLSVAGLGSQLAAAPRGAVRTAAGEAPQEFIEGAGESLGQSALPVQDAQGNVIREGRGALETLADPQARAQAIQSGAIQAPLGSGLGAAIGAPAGVSQVRAQDAANRQEAARIAEERAQENQILQAGAQAQEAIDTQQPVAPQFAGAENQAAQEAAIQARDAQVEQIRQTQFTTEVAPTPLTPDELAVSTRAQRQAASQPTQQPIRLREFLDTFTPDQLDALVDQGPEAVENSFRALYRNEIDNQEEGDGLVAAEDAFINNLNQINFDTTPHAEVVQRIRESAAFAQDAIVEPPTTPTPDVSPTPEPTPPVDATPITDVDPIAGIQITDQNEEAFVEYGRLNNLIQPLLDQIDDVQSSPASSVNQDLLRAIQRELDPLLTQRAAIIDELRQGSPGPVTIEGQRVPEPIVATPDTTGVNPATLFEATDDGLVIQEAQRPRIESLRTLKGDAYADLTPKERREIRSESVDNEGLTGAQAQTTINRLSKLEDLTPSESNELATAVSTLERLIARKKPVTPAEGEVNSAPTFQPNPNDPQTATPEFREFFEGSKVVDTSGTPVVLFHGTQIPTGDNAFTTKEGFRSPSKGIFFTPDRTVAESYASEDIFDPNTDDFLGTQEVGEVGEIYLNLRNPIVIDARDAFQHDLGKRREGVEFKDLDPNLVSLLTSAGISDSNQESLGNNFSINRIRQEAEKLGYDGAIVLNTIDQGSESSQDQYIAFEPTQIKSATDNSGSFDSSNPDIRQSRTSSPTQTSLTGSARAPLSSGLLPDTDGSARQAQSFNTQGVQDVVDQITTDWKKVPKIEIVETTVALPEKVRPTNGALLGGVTDGATAYLVADQLTSPAQIESVLSEELFHKGLMKSLGGNYDPTLARIFKKRGGVDGLLKLGTKYNIANDFVSNYQDVIAAAQSGDREAQAEMTDEIMARVAQSPNLPTGLVADIKQIAAKVKKYLKQFFPDSWFDNVTDADLLLMISEANAAGREEGVSGVPVRQSRTTPGEVYFRENGELQRFNVPAQEFRDASDPSISDAVKLIRETAIERAANAPRSREGVRKSLANFVNRNVFYGKLQKRISDGRVAAQRTEGEFRQLSDNDVLGIFSAVDKLDLPPSVKRLLNGTLDNTTAGKQLRESLSAVHSAATTMIGRGMRAATQDIDVDGQGGTMYQKIQAMNESVQAVADFLDITNEQAKQTVASYKNALHAKERNDDAWLRSAENLEGSIIKEEHAKLVSSLSEPGADRASIVANIKDLVDTHSTVSREDFRGSGMTDAEAADLLQAMQSDPSQRVLLESGSDAFDAVIQASNTVRRKTGSFSRSQQEAIDALGWTNYVPLRGKGVNPDETQPEYNSVYAQDVFNITFRPFQGRESLVENIYDNVQNIALSAVEEFAAQEVLDRLIFHAVASQTSEYQKAFEADGANGELFKGKVFDIDINSKGFKDLMKQADPFRFVRYHSDNENSDVQLATIIRLDNSEGADAIRGARSATADAITQVLNDANVAGVSLPKVTQFTASLKTYRAIPFIPFSGLREAFTNGYVAASVNGYKGFQDYVDTFLQGNYLRDIWKYVSLFSDNDFEGLQQFVAEKGKKSKDNQSVVKQIDDFFQLGGPTSYLSSIRATPPGSLESISKLGDTGNVAKSTVAKLDNLFTKLNGTMDLMARFAYYKSLVDNGTSPDVAAARAKNIANFEQTGTWSGPMGAMFEFARPSATSATGLINATLTGRYGMETAAVTFGAGAMIYLAMTIIAGQDDEDVDYMAEVNGKLLVNNIVFQWGDEKDERIQVPQGFGPIAGALGSGMQAMRFLLGHQSLKDTADNMSSSLANQFKVLPTSGISPLSQPFEFAGNSVTPSILKPIYEVLRNISGLGIPVRSQGFGPASDADSFGARYNSEEELYDQMTQALSNTFGIEWNPDNVKHIMRGYGGTITQLVEMGFEGVQAATSDEEFTLNKKNAFYPFRSFIASPLGQTQDNFYRDHNRMSRLDQRIKNLRRRDLPGDAEEADALEDAEGFRENLDAFEVAERAMGSINDEYRPAFKNGNTTTAQKRVFQKERDALLFGVFRQYLDSIVR